MTELRIDAIEYILTIEKPSTYLQLSGEETVLRIEIFESPDTVLSVSSGTISLATTELEIVPLNLPYGITLLSVEVGSTGTVPEATGSNYGVVLMYDENYPLTTQTIFMDSGKIESIEVRQNGTDILLFERTFTFNENVLSQRVTTDYINNLELTEVFDFSGTDFTKVRSLVRL